MLQAHAFTAAQILVRLREQGFAGGYSIVKDYVRSIRPPKSRAYLTLAFAPGECAQVDWGSYGSVAVGNTRRRLSFFAMVLCYSRMLYVEFTVSQSLEHFLACHKNAFDFFGHVPKKIMVDNLKSAVLSALSVGRRCSIPDTWSLPTTTALPSLPATWAGATGRGPGRKRGRLCQKELSRRPGDPRFCRHRPGGKKLA